jgi:hypothetical protein
MYGSIATLPEPVIVSAALAVLATANDEMVRAAANANTAAGFRRLRWVFFIWVRLLLCCN